MRVSGWITVTVEEVRGSAPRGPGTAMRIFADGQDGTIGGGALEWQATGIAREMLETGQTSLRETVPLGPSLGQCCGGTVVLNFVRDGRTETPVTQSIWIWGAGHVGRAVISALAPLPDIALTWVDTDAARFPPPAETPVDQLIAADPPRAVPHAPANASHLILTYSHDIDLKLCDALLRHGFNFCGLIGSSTKWARFRTRLAALGHRDSEISGITCPIGDPSLGKHPQAIALGVAGQLLKQAAVRGEHAS